MFLKADDFLARSSEGVDETEHLTEQGLGMEDVATLTPNQLLNDKVRIDCSIKALKLCCHIIGLNDNLSLFKGDECFIGNHLQRRHRGGLPY